jgi:hypothetical protein
MIERVRFVKALPQGAATVYSGPVSPNVNIARHLMATGEYAEMKCTDRGRFRAIGRVLRKSHYALETYGHPTDPLIVYIRAVKETAKKRGKKSAPS